MRRCRLCGIKRLIGADEAHVGTRHGQQHWKNCGNRSQIRRSSILRSLDVLLSQKMVERQGGDAFKAAGSLHGERRGAIIRPRYSAALVSKGFKPATLAMWAKIRRRLRRLGEQNVPEVFVD